ncbi:alpha/beta hydrolase [Chitinophaga rhizophila]|uniref:Lysophospholipase n=1 Tax=Chitinophaga rhizophila TaxID=2866212 RepID=A0ABS7GE06_9BACT|nr:alpha/beta fold hydrolase [Chitinophaga rhizophila]MBW8685561.1 lysophospholipase [Chitinophaga rhizophila]
MFRKLKLKPMISILLGVYLAGAALLTAFQEKLIFHPEPLTADYALKYDIPFEEMNIRINEKETLSAVLFKAAAPKGIVLYFHGNARNVSKYGHKARQITDRGYDVLMMDYPTFGKSTGKLTEQAIYTNALHMYEVARKFFPPDSIILYGRSLGSGVAAQLAAIRDCKRLVLEAPYFSMTDMARRFMPIYPYKYMLEFKFPTDEYLPKVTAPVVIIHGTDDHTVPMESGKKLEKLFKKGDRFISIPGADHTNLDRYPDYLKALDIALR